MDPIMDLRRAHVRRLERLMDRTDEVSVYRRALAVWQMGQCSSMVEVERRIDASRPSLYRWQERFETADIQGLRRDERGAPRTTVTDELKRRLREVLDKRPTDFGYVASRWTSPLLADVLDRQFGLEVHPSTLRRLLPKLGYSWTRARPAESWRQDPNKEEKLAAIHEATSCQKPYTDVFHLDEAKLRLMPKLGYGWQSIGAQQVIPTPGRNEMHCIAAALHKDSNRLTWLDGPSHDTDLLLRLLESLHLRYRRSRHIIVIMDNASSHTSKRTEAWFEAHERFEVRYQPTYTPAPNRVEKVWKQLHEAVTRNHRHQTMESLMAAARHWLNEVDVFPNSEAIRTARIEPQQITEV